MGKNLEALKSRFAQIQADAERLGYSEGAAMYAFTGAAYKVWAEHYAQLCDLKDIELNADQKPQVARTGMAQVVIKLDNVKLTVEGTYTGEEAESEDSIGRDAEFEVDGVYAGRTELTDLLTDRIDEIALLAQVAYEEAAAEAAAAAQFERRAA